MSLPTHSTMRRVWRCSLASRLHVNLFQNSEEGWRFLPPYTSLVSGYQALQ